jgi:hypothetical protein
MPCFKPLVLLALIGLLESSNGKFSSSRLFEGSGSSRNSYLLFLTSGNCCDCARGELFSRTIKGEPGLSDSDACSYFCFRRRARQMYANATTARTKENTSIAKPAILATGSEVPFPVVGMAVVVVEEEIVEEVAEIVVDAVVLEVADDVVDAATLISLSPKADAKSRESDFIFVVLSLEVRSARS